MKNARVLVAEKIGDPGVDLLREHFEVDVGSDWSVDELDARIGEYDGILIRSATQLDSDRLDKAQKLRAVGRAGVGVDNVDVAAATKRGIVVANAPQSNVITAAEHTMALLLALARNVPQAHSSLTSGRWDRSKFSGVELYEKTLGILGFGRIGQLVAQRARGFNMKVVAYDPFVGADRYRELGVEAADSPDAVYAVADFLTLHLPKTPDTEGWLNSEVLAKCKDGVRILNVARGPLVVDEDLRAALDSGKVAGAALDVFRSEPVTEHPLFGYPNVIVTPHLGASTAEATDRAGYQAAEQVVAALTGGVVTSAVNVPAIPPEDVEALGPVPARCATRWDGSRSRWPWPRAPRSTVCRPISSAVWPTATRGCCRSRCCSACSPTTSRRTSTRSTPRRSPRSGASGWSRPSTAAARDYTDFVRVEVTAGETHGSRRRHADRTPEPAPPDRGLGPAVRRPARGPHHPVPLPGPSGDARSGRDHVRRARSQHRLRRRGPPARGGPQRRRAAGGDGDHDDLAGAARGGGRDRPQRGILRRSDRRALARRVCGDGPGLVDLRQWMPRSARGRSRTGPCRRCDASTMCEAFQLTAAARPVEVALRTIGDGISITFGEYADRVRPLAAALHALGVRRGDTVGFMLTNRPEFHLLDTAVMHLGGTPFSIYNTSPPSRSPFCLRDAGCRVVVVEAAFLERMQEAIDATGAVEHLIVLDADADGALTLERLEAGRAG